MSDSSSPLAAIVGAGPGLGTALAERFAAGDHAIALLSRHEKSRARAMEQLRAAGRDVAGYDCDAGDPASVASAFASMRDMQGNPTVLLYNAGLFLHGNILDLEPQAFEAAWRINCQGGLLTAREVLPAMCRAGHGTVLFTGATAAVRGGAGFAGFAVGKFGLRALAQSMAREFGPQGIHVGHVIIDGRINPATDAGTGAETAAPSHLDPGAIADNFWLLHQQPRSAWTQELDLRPNAERF